MSLLFDHALTDFTRDDSTLYTPTETELAQTTDPIPLRPIIEFAAKQSPPHVLRHRR